MNTAQPVLYEVRGSKAFITLNRPEKRNALNEDLIAGLGDAFERADADEQVSCVVLTGAGKDFCSGADLSALQIISQGSVMDNLEDAQSLMDLFMLMRRVRMPVIAVVRGRALAGGCGLATACDLVLAAKSSTFGYPEVKVGFVPAIVMAILRRNVSEKRAFELVTTGKIINAHEAEHIGLINHAFEDDQLDAGVEEATAIYETVSRTAVMLAKRLLYHTDGMSFSAAMQSGVDTNTIARMTDDCRAGVEKFTSKK
ncbi:MAG: enoyl-CoA hydratase-related protein [Pyrinomonadaceae bacterium]